MIRRCLVALAVTLLPGAATAGVCVVNGSDHRHFFAAEAKSAPRLTGWLDPGERLCSDADGGAGGVVSVYEAEDGFEGCSRLVAAGETETLMRYASFDRCRWSSHDG